MTRCDSIVTKLSLIKPKIDGGVRLELANQLTPPRGYPRLQAGSSRKLVIRMWMNNLNLSKLGCVQVSIAFHNSRGQPKFASSGRLFEKSHLTLSMANCNQIYTSEANVIRPALLNDRENLPDEKINTHPKLTSWTCTSRK